MRLASFRHADGRAGWGMVNDGGIVDLGQTAPGLRQALAQGLDSLPSWRTADFPLEAVTLAPPIIDPGKILCLGLNYRSHILETGREPPARPMVFTRFANTQVGHLQPLIRPNVSEQFDYEGELAVIIGRRGRHIAAADAFSHVAGYACYNDGSIRDWQRHSIQFTPGKNFIGTGGFGPWIVTADEIADVTECTLVTRLNDQEVQRATIGDMVFDIPAIIEYCSTFTELEPGDVILTGTTGGVGAARTPPLWLKPGDIVEVEISGIGLLRNPVVQETTPAGTA